MFNPNDHHKQLTAVRIYRLFRAPSLAELEPLDLSIEGAVLMFRVTLEWGSAYFLSDGVNSVEGRGVLSLFD